MKAYQAKIKWTEIFAAHLNAPRFSAFLRGVDLTLPDGQELTLKIKKTLKTPAAKLFQVYPYAYITEMAGPDFIESGCGEAAHALIAIQKSISEAVERCLFRALKSPFCETTSGWATHFSKRKAESAALLELLERDAVLVHALCEIPFLEVNHESLPIWLLSWEKSELRHTRFSRLRILISNEGHFPTLSAAFVDPDGFGVIAHATGYDMSDALLRALAEAARLARMALNGGFSDRSKDLFSNAEKNSMIGPCEQAVAYAHHQPLPAWIFGEGIEWGVARSQWSKHIQKYKKTPISYEFVSVSSEPLFTGFCKSDDVQNLFFGKNSDAERRGDVNRKRLRIIKTSGKLSALPHFVA